MKQSQPNLSWSPKTFFSGWKKTPDKQECLHADRVTQLLIIQLTELFAQIVNPLDS
jgi:hypothetical protein